MRVVLVAAALAALASAQEFRAIAEKAYTFAYPLVLMEYTRRAAMERPATGGSAEMNRFAHLPQFPDDKFHQVIRPNADTLYSSAWLDLSKEPLILHLPDTQERYYLMHFMDAWTETFSVPGKRTTGTNEAWFAIVGPGWKGTLPARAQRIDSPTNMVWLLGRTQTNNASDYGNVHAIQRGFVLMPLSLYPDGPPAQNPARATPQTAEPLTPPMQVARLSTVEFFGTFAELLVKNPPHAGDAAIMQELRLIGIAPGQPFDPGALGATAAKEIDQGAQAAASRLANLGSGTARPGKTGWSGMSANVGRYGTNYTARAVIARIGLGALPPEDAIYVNCNVDSTGQPLDGAQLYTMHFDKGQTPPVRAFWSVTMYGEDGYFVHNPINRFAIGDRDPLKFNADGSLDLYLQHSAPGADKDANWLPSPEGKFNLSLRMYWPSEDAASGRWTPPPVVRR